MKEFKIDRPYKSLPSGFTWTDISDLSAITGLNGVGKTHLLQAISEQEKDAREVSFVSDDWAPQGFKKLEQQIVSQETELLPKHCESLLKSALNYSNSCNSSRDYGVFMRVLVRGSIDFEGFTDEDISEWGESPKDGPTKIEFRGGALSEITNVLMKSDAKWADKFGKKSDSYTIPEIIEICTNFLELKSSDITDSLFAKNIAKPITKGSDNINHLSDIFSLSLFSIRNQQAINSDLESAKTAALAKLGIVKFPWDELNVLLGEHKYKIKILEPDLTKDIFDYEIKFQKEGEKDILDIKDLSSGEKMIINTFILVYLTRITDLQSSVPTSTAAVIKPQLLLLDEPDAHLNPALVGTFLYILKKELVAKGVQVLMTTHNPITANHLEKDNLFVMSRDRSGPVITKVKTKQEAVKLLSGNLVTVSDNFGVVFTESGDDANFFSEVFEQLCDAEEIENNPTLKFRATANKLDKKPKQEEGGGKSAVKTLVGKMREMGLEDFIYGVIDSDKTAKNPNGNSIEEGGGIVAPQGRHSIENYLCDPVILLFMIEKCGSKNKQYDDFRQFFQQVDGNYFPKDIKELQPRIDGFFKAISARLKDYKKSFGDTFNDNEVSGMIEDIDSGRVASVEYINGQTLYYPKSIVATRGHDLSRVMAIAMLNSRSGKGTGFNNKDLLGSFKSLGEAHPGFIPTDLAESIRKLQSFLIRDSLTRDDGKDSDSDLDLDIPIPVELDVGIQITATVDFTKEILKIKYIGKADSKEYESFISHNSVTQKRAEEKGDITIQAASEIDGINYLIVRPKDIGAASYGSSSSVLKEVMGELGLSATEQDIPSPVVSPKVSRAAKAPVSRAIEKLV